LEFAMNLLCLGGRTHKDDGSEAERGNEQEDRQPVGIVAAHGTERPAHARALRVSKRLFDLHAKRIDVDDVLGRACEGCGEQPWFVLAVSQAFGDSSAEATTSPASPVAISARPTGEDPSSGLARTRTADLPQTEAAGTEASSAM
jgi:hypothetical protein